jgi:hypothetical protein
MRMSCARAETVGMGRKFEKRIRLEEKAWLDGIR